MSFDSVGIEEIKDYQVCGLYYKYKYHDKLFMPMKSKEIFIKRYEVKLKSILSFLFYKMQSGYVPSYAAILNRWEKLWFPSSTDSYDIAVRQQEQASKNLTNLSTQAAAVLLDVYQTYVESNFIPMIISEDFYVPVGMDFSIAGNFDLVLKNVKTKDVFAIKWVASVGRLKKESFNLDMALLKAGVDSRPNHKMANVHFGLYDLTGDKRLVPVTVDQSDVDSLFFWAEQTRKEETYIPRRGMTKYCAGCPFDKPCSSFKVVAKNV